MTVWIKAEQVGITVAKKNHRLHSVGNAYTFGEILVDKQGGELRLHVVVSDKNGTANANLIINRRDVPAFLDSITKAMIV